MAYVAAFRLARYGLAYLGQKLSFNFSSDQQVAFRAALCASAPVLPSKTRTRGPPPELPVWFLAAASLTFCTAGNRSPINISSEPLQ